MKLKLTYAQFCTFTELLKDVVNDPYIPTYDVNEKLLAAILAKLYAKFYKKAIYYRKHYNVTLEDYEALAFHIYFDGHTWDDDGHCGNLINMTRNQIDKKYA